MWWVLFLAAGWLAAPGYAYAENEMVKALQESLDSDLLVITIKQLKPRKVFRQDSETLLSLHGKGDAFFGVKLDRHNKKVTLETRSEKKQIKVPSLEETKQISSFVLLLDQSKSILDISIYINCNKEGQINFSENLKQMFEEKSNPLMKVYRERKYITDLDSDTEVQEVLKRLKCQANEQMLATQPQPADEIPEEERAEVHIRGDIPILHDCDDNLLIKTINQLIGVVKRLQDELESQRMETRNLRQLLEQCDICRPGEGY